MKYILILLTIICFGCSFNDKTYLPNNTENCKYILHTTVESANVPLSATINQPIAISVQYSVLNGCGGFNNIEETTIENTKTIRVNAKYQGCGCYQALQSLQTNYNVTFATFGTKTIKFLQPDNSVLTYFINIQ